MHRNRVCVKEEREEVEEEEERLYLLKVGYFQNVTFNGKIRNQDNPDRQKNMEATHMA